MSTSSSNSHLRIDPTAHIADKAILHTSSHHPHPIVIGAHCVVHPFARLDSASGPVALGERCVIWEKTVIGTSRSSSRPSSHSGASSNQTGAAEEDDEAVHVKTITIGEGTIVQPHARIVGPATIGAKCNIGVAAEIGSGVVLGEGVTVASGVHVEDQAVLEKGCVVFSEGNIRKPGRGANPSVQHDLQRARDLKEEGEERHRLLTTKLVKGTAGGTRFTT